MLSNANSIDDSDATDAEAADTVNTVTLIDVIFSILIISMIIYSTFEHNILILCLVLSLELCGE